MASKILDPLVRQAKYLGELADRVRVASEQEPQHKKTY